MKNKYLEAYRLRFNDIIQLTCGDDIPMGGNTVARLIVWTPETGTVYLNEYTKNHHFRLGVEEGEIVEGNNDD